LPWHPFATFKICPAAFDILVLPVCAVLLADALAMLLSH